MLACYCHLVITGTILGPQGARDELTRRRNLGPEGARDELTETVKRAEMPTLMAAAVAAEEREARTR